MARTMLQPVLDEAPLAARTPSKKKPSSDDSGDEVDDPPKRPAKKAKDSTPLNMFHAKVGQAKGKKAPPKKK